MKFANPLSQNTMLQEQLSLNKLLSINVLTEMGTLMYKELI